MRTLPLASLLLSAAACAPGTVSFDEGTSGLGTGWATEPFETYEGTTTATDDGLSAYDDAVLTVLSPSPSEFIPLGTVAVFEAEIVGRDGTVLDSPIEWQSSTAPGWYEQGALFETTDLPLGLHDFTAQTTLPNGDHLVHTISSVRVQHPFAGTYAGLYDVDGTILNFPVTCIGVAILTLEADGTFADGDGECLISLLGIDVPLNFLFEFDIEPDGTLSGTAGADLVGFFTYNFPADGSLDPSGSLSMSFEGDVPLFGLMSGGLDAPRISLDTVF